MNKIIKFVLQIMCSFAIIFAMVACGETVETKKASSIKIENEPTKTEYYVNEEFSVEGGNILVTYEDTTTEIVPMNAEGVEITSPNMANAGKKTITVKYLDCQARFYIYVYQEDIKITLDLNYEGATNIETSVISGEKLQVPSVPTRANYTFYNWYTDEACMLPYDFDTIVTESFTLYAEWKENGATYYDVSYDIGYYGNVPQTFVKIIKAGQNAILPSIEMKRDEFTFDGWYVRSDMTTKFTTSTVINSNVDVIGKWTKTKTGSSQYIFEAEYTSLEGKVGPGISGTAQEEGMIVPYAADKNATYQASNSKAVSFLYKNGLTLDYYLGCSEKVTNAKLTIRVAGEMKNVNFNSDQYQVIVNGTPLSYAAVSLSADNVFSDAIVINNVTLNEGFNSIILKTNNSIRPLGDASTYEATAPVVDCIKIDTSAVVIWDQNYNLPMEY